MIAAHYPIIRWTAQAIWLRHFAPPLERPKPNNDNAPVREVKT